MSYIYCAFLWVLFCFCVTIVLWADFSARSLALELLCDGELSEALRTSSAAGLFNQLNELCDQIFNSMTSNVIKCEYMDIYYKTLNLQNDSSLMILMHLNIRSLQKNNNDF